MRRTTPSVLTSRAPRLAVPVAAVLFTAAALALASDDFTSFRGDFGRGTAASAPFTAALQQSWTRPIGSAYSGMAIAGDRLVTAEAQDGRDTLVALSLETGDTLWSLDLAEAYKGHGGSQDGVIATPAVDRGVVFAVGPYGQVVAAKLDDGSELWRQRIGVADTELAAEAPYYGFASSPLVVGDLVVVQVGNPGGAAVALQRDSGEIAWRAPGDGVYAQSPILGGGADAPQILVASNTAITGLDPEEGEVLWRYPVDANRATSLSMSPIYLPDGSIYAMVSDDRSVVLEVPATGGGAEPPQAEAVWEQNALTRTYSPPALIGDQLVGFTSRLLTAYSVDDGARLWRSRAPGDGFLLGLGDVQAVVLTKEGSLHLGAVKEGWQEQWSLQGVFEDLVWTPPAYANGSVYLRSMTEITRFDLLTDRVTEVEQEGSLPDRLKKLEDRSPAGIDAFLADVQTPLIDGDRALFLWRGEAQDVGIGADFLGMRREEAFARLADTDLWWYEVALDPELAYHYLLFVDYEPALDPLNPRSEFNTVWGYNLNWVDPGIPAVEMSVVEMPGRTAPPSHLAADAEAPAQRGRLDTVAFEIGRDDLTGPSMGPPEGVDYALEQLAKPNQVWLPPGYDATDDRYPVVYLLKGSGALDEKQGAWIRTLDRRVGRDFAPLIVVFLDGPLPSALPMSAIFETIDSKYRTLPDRTSRALISMGMVSFEPIARAGTERAAFGAFGVQDFFGFDEEVGMLLGMVQRNDELPLRGYLEWGRQGARSETEGWDMRAWGQQVYDGLEERGVALEGGEQAESIGWMSWRNRTHTMLGFLFPPE
ncbi:MAG: PQQ-binding-like beta-propeller repeat protein [Acidobacteriota bacterium]